ncbi:hypothetical protein [Pedobacter puniceum]|jgi:hypothetical protein|uniref:Uncharacterized protein n=1 Tax=Pedobacter puniceum TaxID=2666136 RepID=A0A7K0FSE0_9SPHI|nr:hypothetical protein [Pedobacter puniceum]MRX48200.1 hypothetical protein [Pedobacter puniceum]
MKNISHFVNFKAASTSVLQWITSISKITEAKSAFCDTQLKQNAKEKQLNLVAETDSSEVYSKQTNLTTLLPELLQGNFSNQIHYPIFNAQEILKSENNFKQVLDTQLIILNCSYIDDKGIKLDTLTSKIINKAKCPILFLPDDVQEPKQLKNVVYCTDIRFTEVRFIRAFGQVAKHLNCDLTLAHASDSGIPDLDIEYGKQLYKDCFAGRISDCKMNLENLRRLDIQKYPDLIHEYLLGDVYSMINKNHLLKDGDYLESVAIKLARIAKKPILVINN